MSPSINMIMLLGAAVAWAENAPMGYQVPPAAMTTAAASPADCAATCFAAYRDCQTNPPDSNKSLCASNLAKCLNYNPFDNSGTFVTPTACSSSAPATATAPAPAAATTAPAGDAAQCAATCFAAYRDCQTNPPDSNKSLCASNLASCLGYNPFDNSGTFVTPTACSSTAAATAPAPAATTAPAGDAAACAKACNEADDKCRFAPDANMSFCASELAKCLGYNPYDNSNTFITPTACSTTAAATAPAPAATTAPASGGSTTPDACAKACNDADDKCRTAPDANMSFCASELAKCLGYNPYDNSNTFITPTACSTSGAPAATGAGEQPAATTAGGAGGMPGGNMPTGTMTMNMATGTGNATATATRPATYTGAATLLESYGSFVAVAAGAVAMMV